MKKSTLWWILPLLCLVLLCWLPQGAAAAEGIAIHEDNFPDADFREHVRILYDKDGDNVFSQAELDSARSIVLLPGNVQSLQGIEHFHNLEILDCHANAIYSLDLSQNPLLRELHCQNNELTQLDLSANTALTYLDCSTNLLTALDLSANTQLKDLYCFHNHITQLNLQSNPELRRLECNNNVLTDLDLSGNSKLDVLDCSTNALTALDVSQNKYLTNLNCSYNQIAELKFYNLLKIFSCGYNQLTTLDVRSCSQLTRLICCDNLLTSLDLTENKQLTYLNCEHNQLSIPLSAQGTFELSTLPGFDASKTSHWTGGALNGSILIVESGATAVTYSYKCSSSMACTFTLVPVAHRHSFGPWEVATPATCLEAGVEQQVCTICQATQTQPIDALGHDFDSSTQYTGDETGHSKKCVRCPETEGFQPHEGGTLTCTQQAVCSVCQGTYGTPPGHSFISPQQDDTHHWNQCVNCGTYDEKVPHTGGTASCTAKANCSVCQHPYGELLPHSYGTIWKSDGESHWLQCDCGQRQQQAAHIPGPAATETEPQVCTQCAYILQPATGHVNHSYTVLQSDSTHHWYKCSGCNQVSQKAAHDGGAASCTGRATCTACGTLYGQLAEHDFSLLQQDSNYHWYRCQGCDATQQKAPHSYGQDSLCSQCGYCRIPEPPQPTEPVPTQPTATLPDPTLPATTHPSASQPNHDPIDEPAGSLWIYLCGLLTALVAALAIALILKGKRSAKA